MLPGEAHAVAGVRHPGDGHQANSVFPMNGHSLAAWLTGSAASLSRTETAHCWELFGRRGVLKGDWKALWLEPPYGQSQWELYNLKEDLGEQDDLAASHPEKLQELIGEWEAYVKACEVIVPSEPTAYGSEAYWQD